MSPPLPATRRTVLDAAALSLGAVRIPALLRCADGRLLVFAEARHEGPGDTGQIDVIASTSTDGQRWSTPVVVAEGAGGTRGNPVPVEAADGDVVLLTTSNSGEATEAAILAGTVAPEEGRRVHVTRLSPDLTRIGPSREITDQVKRPEWRWYATGPGHGIRLPSGRLVVAANHSRPPDPVHPSPYGAHGLISDDDGHSWRIAWTTDGADGASGPNESALTTDPADPREAVVTIRNEHREDAAARSIAATGGGGSQLARHAVLAGFRGPRIQAGIGTLPAGGPVLLTAPRDAAARRGLTLHVVDGDECRAVGLLVPGPAGYSDLAVSPDAVHVLVETGESRAHERIELITIDLPTALRAIGPPKELHP